MSAELPTVRVPRVAEDWGIGDDLANWSWDQAAALPPLILADGSKPAEQQTVTRLCYNDQALFVRFDCDDRDIWGTYTERDAAIYDEEVVEVFLGAGRATPVDYYEFEVSPDGVMLDLTCHSPNGNRDGLIADFAWDCPGLRWAAGRDDADNHWWGIMALPWSSLGVTGKLPKVWRANFYRIERPRDGSEPEFSCWSPTLTDPADYHRPARFGIMELG